MKPRLKMQVIPQAPPIKKGHIDSDVYDDVLLSNAFDVQPVSIPEARSPSTLSVNLTEQSRKN